VSGGEGVMMFETHPTIFMFLEFIGLGLLLFSLVVIPVIQTSYQNEKKKKINALPSEYDFPFSTVPAPWKLSQKEAQGKQEYLLQLGKGFNACIVMLKLDFPKEKLLQEDYFLSQWKVFTSIKSPKGLEQEILEAGAYQYIVVKSKEYTPVMVFVIPKGDKRGYLVVQTELSRYRNDLKEIERLLRE